MIAASQVNLTGNPAESSKYRTNASMLGRAKELKTPKVVEVALVGMGGIAFTSGCSKNCHSCAPQSSRHLLSMVSLAWSKTAIVSLVKSTLK